MYSTRVCKYGHDPLCLVFIPISLLLLSWMLSIVLTLRFSLPLKKKYFCLCMITFSPEYGDFSILLRVIDLLILKIFTSGVMFETGDPLYTRRECWIEPNLDCH